MKYILIQTLKEERLASPNSSPIVKFFNDLIGVYRCVCDDLTYSDFDIEDFMIGGASEYTCVEERIQEHGMDYFVFENGKEHPLFSLFSSSDDSDSSNHDWEKFTEFCFSETETIKEPIKENIVIRFQQFNEGKKDKFPNLKKMDIDGFVVYIGRDALSNDHLTFNMARPEDIWMHTKGIPGSHVVIRVRDNLPALDTIKKVAKLAVKNSKSKSEKTIVVYCQRKFVKKEKGMKPGEVKVDYINAEEITI